MECALLSASHFVSPQNREVCGYVRHFQSSFCGRKVISNNQFIRRNGVSIQHRSSIVITSLLGRKVKNVREKPSFTIQIFEYQSFYLAIYIEAFILQSSYIELYVYTDNILAAASVGLLGLLLLFQTTRVRFAFYDEALEVKVGEQLEESGENVFVGGKNRWKYSTFVNWELWWPNFPILVYFETQTKPEGQVHFFPVIFNGKQLYDVMVERAGPSQTSGPE